MRAKPAAAFIAAVVASVPMVLGSAGAKGETPMLRPAAPAAVKLVISGSSTMAPMLLALGRRFSILHPDVRIEVRSVGSGQGIVEVSRGVTDIAMASRMSMNKGDGLSSFAIARDGVCLVVHKDNPIASLDKRQVRDIFTGKTTSWKTVGGNEAPIVVVNAPETSGTVELFTNYFGIPYAEIKPGFVANFAAARAKIISDNPTAVAYMSVGSALTQAGAGAPIKLLPADGVAATMKNIRTGNFPLSRPLLLLAREHPMGVTREFISFSLSSQATDLVLKNGFVPYLD